MLKKIFAKIRDSISPSRSSKTTPAATSKPAVHSKSHTPAHRTEPRPDRSHGHGGKPAGGQRGTEEGTVIPARPKNIPAKVVRIATITGMAAGDVGITKAARDEAAVAVRSAAVPSAGERPRKDDTFDHPRREPVKPVIPVDVPKMDTEFTKLGLSDALAFGVQQMGYMAPTPIQAQAIPVVLQGGDVIGSAQTGTGKTAAFALPIIQRLGGHGKLRCLILEPTRELALQVEEAFQKFAKFTDLRVTIVYGGVGYGNRWKICSVAWTFWLRPRAVCWTIWSKAIAR